MAQCSKLCFGSYRHASNACRVANLKVPFFAVFRSILSRPVLATGHLGLRCRSKVWVQVQFLHGENRAELVDDQGPLRGKANQSHEAPRQRVSLTVFPSVMQRCGKLPRGLSLHRSRPRSNRRGESASSSRRRSRRASGLSKKLPLCPNSRVLTQDSTKQPLTPASWWPTRATRSRSRSCVFSKRRWK